MSIAREVAAVTRLGIEVYFQLYSFCDIFDSRFMYNC